MRKSSLSIADHELETRTHHFLWSQRTSIHEDFLIERGWLQPMRHDRSLEPMMVASFLCMNKNMFTRFCWYCEFKCFKGGPEGCKNPACAATLVSYLLIGMVTIAPLFNSTNCIETHTKLLT